MNKFFTRMREGIGTLAAVGVCLVSMPLVISTILYWVFSIPMKVAMFYVGIPLGILYTAYMLPEIPVLLRFRKRSGMDDL